MSNLSGCPFCGCAMTVQSSRDWHHIAGQHEDGCVFDMDNPPITVPAEEQALAWAIETWNRRAPPQAAGGEPVAWIGDAALARLDAIRKTDDLNTMEAVAAKPIRTPGSHPLYLHPPAVGQEWETLQAAVAPFIQHNSSEEFIDIRVPTAAVTRLRAIVAAAPAQPTGGRE